MWTDRREEGGRSVSCFMSFSFVYDTVAINKRSAEQSLFIRSISQSGHIKKPMKSWSASCGFCACTCVQFWGYPLQQTVANRMLHFKQENQSQFSFCLYCIMLCELVHAVIGCWWLCSCLCWSSWCCRTCELDVASHSVLTITAIHQVMAYHRAYAEIAFVFVWTTLAYRCSYLMGYHKSPFTCRNTCLS